ncbi:hypothetical protein L6452_14359 [Arctium lappa]|uniref:Uncharacterized protein n=1 Tax=Arctium lappa TaxID=4217 RepID=A0ACB9CKP5_ARCLA|nr:hypothetical protein L6452_14359 [Arctium lappa]
MGFVSFSPRFAYCVCLYMQISSLPQIPLLCLHQFLPPISSFDGVSVDFSAISSHAESLMYTLVDAVVVFDSAASASGDLATSTVLKSSGCSSGGKEDERRRVGGVQEKITHINEEINK